MKFYPIFLNLENRNVLVCGATETAAAKIRLLKKTGARIRVFGRNPTGQIKRWSREGVLKLVTRNLAESDIAHIAGRGGIALIFAASGEKEEDMRITALARRNAMAINVVDDLGASDFLTPAIVDRSPVTVAIGTEGTAPVLARRIKAQIEEILPSETGALARIARGFRAIASQLPQGRTRRNFWASFFEDEGPRAHAGGGEKAALKALEKLFDREMKGKGCKSSIALIGAGPGEPELMSLRGRKRMDEADIVIHDRRIGEATMDLARREAKFIEINDIHENLMDGLDLKQFAGLQKDRQEGCRIACIVPGSAEMESFSPHVIRRLDEQGIPYEIIPGPREKREIAPAPALAENSSGTGNRQGGGFFNPIPANSNRADTGSDAGATSEKNRKFGVLESLI